MTAALPLALTGCKQLFDIRVWSDPNARRDRRVGVFFLDAKQTDRRESFDGTTHVSAASVLPVRETKPGNLGNPEFPQPPRRLMNFRAQSRRRQARPNAMRLAMDSNRNAAPMIIAQLLLG
ncbi:MAG: hypothetical protein OXU96_01625 [Gammaproteobacteria bacterium]|nr:hypothetical protein [Gammaproteobacteria bacterium]